MTFRDILPLIIIVIAAPMFLAIPFMITKGRIESAREDTTLLPSTRRHLLVRAGVSAVAAIILLSKWNIGMAIGAAFFVAQFAFAIHGLRRIRAFGRQEK